MDHEVASFEFGPESGGPVVSNLPKSLVVILLLFLAAFTARAVDWSDGKKMFLDGNYKQCIQAASNALKESPDDEEWHWLLTKSLLSTGQYLEANRAITNALAQEPRSVRLQWLAREVFLS